MNKATISDLERQNVNKEESALAVWLHSRYTTIFVAAHGTVPAGILGIASLGIGLSVREGMEPIHFLLAALKIVDVDFPAQLDKLDISSEVGKSMCQDANRIKQYLDVLTEKITTVRRRIRHRLARTANPPIPDDQVIHRSRKTRAAFYDAANQVEREVITLLQLMESMFELGFLDVSDMRWRTPTKTFRKGR